MAADGCPPFVERCRSSSPCCRIFSLKVKKEIDGSSSTWPDTHRFYTCGCESYIYTNTHSTSYYLFSFPAILSSVRLHAQRDRCGCLDMREEETLHFFSEKKNEKETSTTAQKQLDYNTNLCGAKYVIANGARTGPPPFRWMPLTNATAQHRLSSLALNSIRGRRRTVGILSH